MTNDEMLAAVLALPAPDLITETVITDGIGAGSYYTAGTVVRVLLAERERCAKVCDQIGRDWSECVDPIDQGRLLGVELCADAIRGGD